LSIPPPRSTEGGPTGRSRWEPPRSRNDQQPSSGDTSWRGLLQSTATCSAPAATVALVHCQMVCPGSRTAGTAISAHFSPSSALTKYPTREDQQSGSTSH